MSALNEPADLGVVRLDYRTGFHLGMALRHLRETVDSLNEVCARLRADGHVELADEWEATLVAELHTVGRVLQQQLN
jgi:hypothetical protein